MWIAFSWWRFDSDENNSHSIRIFTIFLKFNEHWINADELLTWKILCLYLCPLFRMSGNFVVIADDIRGKGLIKANPMLPSGTCRFDTSWRMTALLIFFIVHSSPRFLIRIRSASDYYRTLHCSMIRSVIVIFKQLKALKAHPLFSTYFTLLTAFLICPSIHSD